MTTDERRKAILTTIETATRVISSHDLRAITGVCDRTIYRDIAALRSAGAHIISGPGKGAGYMHGREPKAC